MLNIAASWPAIVGDVVVNEQALESAQILPQLLHEASVEAQQQQQQQLMNRQQPNGEYNWPMAERNESNENEENEDNEGADEEQLQNMLENYQKHVIRQKQRQSSRRGQQGTAGRSASHLQKRMNASQQSPMSHSQPCLLSSSVGQSHHKNDAISGEINGLVGVQTQQQHQVQFSAQNRRFGAAQQDEGQNEVLLQRPHDLIGIGNQQQQLTKMNSECNGNGNAHSNEPIISQLKTQNEKLRKKSERLEELERACKRIERDYDQVTAQHERREELQKMAIQKLEQQLRMLSAENEQLRAQSARLSAMFGVVGQGNESEQQQQMQMQLHFLLNELIPKNEELLIIQERQRIELEAQSATLEEQRTHIEVLEKALSNAQERLAAKERSAVDAVAVVDKCSHLQRMLQEALEDKQRQKEDHGRQVAQLEMELTQLRLQFAKDSNPSAIGSIGRKSGGSMAISAGTATEGGIGDEMLKLRKTISLKDDRISQLESGLLEMQRRYNDELQLRETASIGNGFTGGIKSGAGGGGRMAELEALAVRLEQEKFEKERRIHELLDEKCHIQMQWNEERRSLDYRVRLLEKDLRHFMGSQSSLASSSGGGGAFFGAGGVVSPYSGCVGADLLYQHHNSPYASMRDQNLRHRSSAELPTSARIAALYEDRSHGCGLDVLARMEGLGRKMAERRAQMKTSEKSGGSEGPKLPNIARPSDFALSHNQQQSISATTPSSELPQQQQQLHAGAPPSQHPSLPSLSSSSTDHPSHQPTMLVDLSPSSEELLLQHPTNVVSTPTDDDGNAVTPQQQQQRQPSLSTTSSTSSSTKKRYFVSATAVNHSPVNNVFLDQYSESSRRRVTGSDKMCSSTFVGTNSFGGDCVHEQFAGVEQQQQPEFVDQQQTKEDIGISNGGAVAAVGKPLLTRLGPPNRRGEGGCRRLIRDHSIDARRERAEQQHPMASGAVVAMLPPNYHESQKRQPFRRELGVPPPVPPMPSELPPPYGIQMRQIHQMYSIEEPLVDKSQNNAIPSNCSEGNAGKTVVEVKGEEGDSDTLNSHRQLVYRRSSLGNANAIK
ncbi:hypothetical protein niasHT_035170 [Heterodera trifolii]|uniref:Angiomotin C-terminal domain-containing protein n=1 Tax=Heterodera trifolii TaxID=157864 RepID=A0ABD2IWP9_9BILA